MEGPRTFPPRTSSPIIRHAAVWIVLALRSSAEAMVPRAKLLAEVGLLSARGDAVICRVICDKRENMRPWKSVCISCIQESLGSRYLADCGGLCRNSRSVVYPVFRGKREGGDHVSPSQVWRRRH